MYRDVGGSDTETKSMLQQNGEAVLVLAGGSLAGVSWRKLRHQSAQLVGDSQDSSRETLPFFYGDASSSLGILASLLEVRKS